MHININDLVINKKLLAFEKTKLRNAQRVVVASRIIKQANYMQMRQKWVKAN